MHRGRPLWGGPYGSSQTMTQLGIALAWGLNPCRVDIGKDSSGSCTISFWLPSHQLDPSVPQTQQQRTFLSLQWVGSPFSLGFQNMMWAIYLSRSTLKNTILQVLLRIWVWAHKIFIITNIRKSTILCCILPLAPRIGFFIKNIYCNVRIILSLNFFG
jgi:hypothetical protein